MNVTLEISTQFSAVVPDATGSRNEIISLLNKVASGTGGANLNDQMYARARTVTNNATPDVMDLRGGTALLGSDGSAFSVVKLGTIIIVNYSLTQTLKFKPAASSGLTGVGTPFEGSSGIYIPPSPDVALNYFSHLILHCQGATIYTVAAGVDQIQVETDGGAAVPYVIALGGRSS
jgi:hypothetical protein